MKRALRRHHRRRMIKKALKVHKDLNTAVKYYNHLADCSCYMCGNPRHNPWQSTDECLTMQERKAKDDFKDQLNAENIRC